MKLKNSILVKLVGSLLCAIPLLGFAQTQTINANLNVRGAVKVADSLLVDSGVYLNSSAIPYNASLDTSLGIINGRLVRGPGGGGGGGGSTSIWWQKAAGKLYTDSLKVSVGTINAPFQFNVQPLTRPSLRVYEADLDNVAFADYYDGLLVYPAPGDTSFSTLALLNSDSNGTSGGFVLLNNITNEFDDAIFTLQTEYNATGTFSVKEIMRAYVENLGSQKYPRLQANGVLRLQPKTTPDAGALNGDFFFSSTANKPYFYNGTSWVDFSAPNSYWQKGNGILTTDSLNIGIGTNSALWSLTTQYRSRQAYRSQFQSSNNIFTAIENGVYIRNLENDTSNGLFTNITLATINNTNTAGVILNSVSDGVDKAKFTLQVEATPSTGLTNMVEGFSVYSKNSAGNAYGILDVTSMFRLSPRNTSGFTQVDSGSIYYDINTNQPKYYNGTAWKEFSTSNQYQTGIYLDTLGQTANDTVLNLNIETYQAVRVWMANTINNILVNFDTTAYPATGKIFDFSCEIVSDTIYPAPNVVHTANKFQLQFGVEPTLSTFNNTTGQRSDIITYRSSGIISRKRFKVIITNDFRDN